ncbi:class I SAM-dependent methyltransferase [Candidatus Bipolaricaulota bacterium]|nr:class I SAM-dependent methyltransferase [Candidatus Bipolaricaulota bacterium]TFH10336.1 MAG: class I SAM-dependent methyltransferase [Candidatus Atribacteria bacterium]
MSEHPAIDEKRMFLLDQQVIRLEDTFGDDDLILDLGGGGEGIIGQLRGRQVVAVDLRPDELEEIPPGPIKVIADAKKLPFLDASFDVATAFFFLMYVPHSDRGDVLKEAYRVLRPGAALHIWDVTIPARADRPQQMFIVPVKVELPGKTVQTGYGVPWDGREMSAEAISLMASDAGFALLDMVEDAETFHITLVRPTQTDKHRRPTDGIDGHTLRGQADRT